jgi:hypothetical protein
MRTAAVFALFPILAFAQQPQTRVPITPAARQAAQLVGVAPLIAQLEALPAPATGPDATLLRQRILEAVVSASLDVDAVTSGIQNEWSGLFQVAARIRVERDKSVNRLALAGAIVGIGGGIISNALQLGTATITAGNAVGVAAGTVATVVFGLSLHAQKGPQYNVQIAPAMLAPIFGRPTEPGCDYPPVVWTFLNTPPAEGVGPQISWREMLIRQWTEEGRINPANPAKEREKIGFLTAGIEGRRRLSLQDLEDRMAMLNDLRSRVSLMKRDLSALMACVRAIGD